MKTDKSMFERFTVLVDEISTKGNPIQTGIEVLVKLDGEGIPIEVQLVQQQETYSAKLFECIGAFVQMRRYPASGYQNKNCCPIHGPHDGYAHEDCETCKASDQVPSEQVNGGAGLVKIVNIAKGEDPPR